MNVSFRIVHFRTIYSIPKTVSIQTNFLNNSVYEIFRSRIFLNNSIDIGSGFVFSTVSIRLFNFETNDISLNIHIIVAVTII